MDAAHACTLTVQDPLGQPGEIRAACDTCVQVTGSVRMVVTRGTT
jgi:hypothetical protein